MKYLLLSLFAVTVCIAGLGQGGLGPVPPGGTVKYYKAILNQSDSNAPTANVLQNTEGVTIGYSFIIDGVYSITNSIGFFTTNKTFVHFQGQKSGVDYSQFNYTYVSTNEIRLLTTYYSDADVSITGGNGFINNTSLEISVFP